MIKRRSITLFVCFMLMFSIIGGGCTKKGEGTAEASNKTTNEEAVQEDTASEEEEPSAVPVSEDSNSPWKLVSETSVETAVNYAGFMNESIGVTVGYSGATSFTEDGGKTWSKSGNVSACRYGLDFCDESFIMDSGNTGVNLVSKDKGRTWMRVGDFPLKSNNLFNKFLSIIDTENIYVGSQKSLAVSTDGGITWKELEVPKECTKIVGMYFLTPEVGYLMNNDGTLFKTTDSCATWTTQTIDLAGTKIIHLNVPAVAINFQDEDHGMIVYATKDHKLCCIKTEDGGSTWEAIEVPKSSGLAPYLSRDGQYLTLSAATKKICLYKLEEK